MIALAGLLVGIAALAFLRQTDANRARWREPPAKPKLRLLQGGKR